MATVTMTDRRLAALHESFARFIPELSREVDGVYEYGELADECDDGTSGVIVVERRRTGHPDATRTFAWFSVAHNGERWNTVQGHYDLTEQDAGKAAMRYLQELEDRAWERNRYYDELERAERRWA